MKPVVAPYRGSANHQFTAGYDLNINNNIDEIVTTTDGIYTTKEYRDKKNNVLMKTVEDLDGNIFKSVYSYDSYNKVEYSQDHKNIITAYEYEGGLLKKTKSFYYSQFNPAGIWSICKNQTQALIHSRTYTGEGEEYVWEVHDERSEDMKSVNEYGKTCASVLNYQSKTANRGLVTKTTSPHGLETVYTYDDTDDKITGISAQDGSKVYSVMYGYDTKRRLSRITHNGFNYLFDYDGMGRMKTVSIAGSVYSTNTYDTSGATTVSTTYAGGEKLTVTTDRHQNPVKKTYTNASGTESTLAEAEYDNLGKVTKYIDKTTGDVYTYTYNELGEAESVKLNGAEYKTHTYDSHGRLTETKTNLTVNTSAKELRYTPVYEKDSNNNIYPENNVVGVNTDVFSTLTSKDNIGRNIRKTFYAVRGGKFLNTAYTYVDTNTRLSNYVSTLKNSVCNSTGAAEAEDTYSYVYMPNGNIRQIKKNGTVIVDYVYDVMDHVVRENNPELGYTYVYSYDTSGNILSKKTYLYGTSIGSYTEPLAAALYSYDSTNKDRLISYNGESCTYDSKGNPTVYRNNALTWSRVRLLASYGSNTFAYNADGIRIRKNTTAYTLDGSNIIKESRNGTNDIILQFNKNKLTSKLARYCSCMHVFWILILAPSAFLRRAFLYIQNFYVT